MRVTLKVQNGAEFAAKLRQLGRVTSGKLMSAALREGAKIIQAEAKRRVPIETGSLRESIRVRVGKTRGKGEKKIIVSTSADDNMFTAGTFYGAFLEFGHKRGKATAGQRSLLNLKRKGVDIAIAATKGGLATAKSTRSREKLRKRLAHLAGVKSGAIADSRKSVPPKPFMRPAFDHSKDLAGRVVASTLGYSIEQAWGASS